MRLDGTKGRVRANKDTSRPYFYAKFTCPAPRRNFPDLPCGNSLVFIREPVPYPIDMVVYCKACGRQVWISGNEDGGWTIKTKGERVRLPFCSKPYFAERT